MMLILSSIVLRFCLRFFFFFSPNTFRLVTLCWEPNCIVMSWWDILNQRSIGYSLNMVPVTMTTILRLHLSNLMGFVWLTADILQSLLHGHWSSWLHVRTACFWFFFMMMQFQRNDRDPKQRQQWNWQRSIVLWRFWIALGGFWKGNQVSCFWKENSEREFCNCLKKLTIVLIIPT